VLTPLQTTSLIVAFGLVVQGLSVWRLRRALRFDRVWPFLAGGAIGVPIGAELLRWADPQRQSSAENSTPTTAADACFAASP
jgi:uncharacterized membrane protein YfcA